MSVARPISIGPVTDSATLTRDDATTRTSAARCGFNRASSRRADGQKVVGFSPGVPRLIQGSPRPAG